ncbi:MAG: hypothetical protein Q9169_004859 [Polycauliona sp. 2 TL-2023]
MAINAQHLHNLSAGLVLVLLTLLLYICPPNWLRGTHLFTHHVQWPTLGSGTAVGHASKVPTDILVPYGQRYDAVESLVPISYQPHDKRDQALLDEFGCLVSKGIKYFEEKLVKGAGDRPPDFGDDPFGDNGWTLTDDDDDIPEIWDDFFEHLPPREPTHNDYNLVYLNQDRDFTNQWHPKNVVSQPFKYRLTVVLMRLGCSTRRAIKALPWLAFAKGFRQATQSEYRAYYMPFHGTILITTAYSPAYWVKKRGVRDDEVQQHIPKLHQLSDAVWEVWKAIADKPKTLRFLARDGIRNGVTSPLLDYLLKRDRGTLEVPWDRRLTFGLDSDEGKALLATPNGIAVAWLLIHHHETLGSRDPRVSIFQVEGHRCMIWEMIPEGEKSTFDNYKAGFVSQGPGSYGHRDQTNDFSVPSG